MTRKAQDQLEKVNKEILKELNLEPKKGEAKEPAKNEEKVDLNDIIVVEPETFGAKPRNDRKPSATRVLKSFKNNIDDLWELQFITLEEHTELKKIQKQASVKFSESLM